MGKRKWSDMAWQYCTVVDHVDGHVRCNFCGQVMWGGVTRLKQHLACIKGNVIPCRCCPPEVTKQIQEDLCHILPENEDDIDGGGEQVNEMKGGGNEEQFQEEEEDWQKLSDEIREYCADGSPENKEDIDGGSKQVNDMRGEGNEDQLQPEQEIWQKFASDMLENLPDFSRKIQANIDWVSEQVNDMRGEGNEEQSQPKQERWPKSVGDDMFAYFFDHGLEARNLQYEMELKRVNDEYERAVRAVRRQSELTFWECRTLRGEGCSGTKPVPSCREYCMTSDDDSDDDSEIGF